MKIRLKDKIGCDLIFETVETKQDLKAIYRLRYLAYCEELNFEDPDLYPEKEECDEFDQFSIHIAARDRDEIMGTIRLVKDSSLGFPMEHEFGLPFCLDRAHTMEHSRSVVRLDWRGRGIHTLLTEAAYAWQKANGYNICIGAAVKLVSDSLCNKGWRPFGKTRPYRKTCATPIIFYL